MKSILLWLEGPLQSWGVSSRFGRRDTLPFPSLSGILGLICNALGRKGEQREFLADLSACSYRILAFPRKNVQDQTDPFGINQENSESDPFAVSSYNFQSDPPRLKDFQMVGSGYDTDDKWQNLFIPKTSDGKKPVGGGSKLTYRYYLQDMAFAWIQEVPDNFLDEIERGLKTPDASLSLGRRCCIPSDTIYQGAFPTIKEALDSALDKAEKKNRQFSFYVVPESIAESDDSATLNDIPVNFGIYKEYRDHEVFIGHSLETISH